MNFGAYRDLSTALRLKRVVPGSTLRVTVNARQKRKESDA